MAKDEDEREIRRLYHRDGHDTEREAAKAILPKLNYLHTTVLRKAEAFGERGFALVEIERAFPEYVPSNTRTRVNELVGWGLIENTGTKRTFPPSGNQHIIWRVTGKGYPPPPPDPQLSLL
jgi:hypothetical protein